MKTPCQRASGSPALWAAAAIIIGHALWLNDGMYDAIALRWLAAGILAAWAGFFTSILDERWTLGVCVAGYLWFLRDFWNDSPLPELAAPLAYYTVVVPLFAVAGMGAMLLPRLSRTVFIPLLLITQFSYGVWMLHAARGAPIDVYEVTKDACAAMSHGIDPYAIDFPDIFKHTANWETRFYPPGYVYGGRIHFGYQYMPLSFFIAYAGHLIGGDFRFGSLAAITLAGALLAYSRRGALAAAAACLLLLSPRNYLVVDRGWSEPAVVVCLALVIFCSAKRPAWLPWAVGLLMVSKQHMILAAPAMLLLIPPPWNFRSISRFCGKAILIGCAVTLPMVLWNVHAFWHSAIEVQLKNPFRFDSLNFAAAWAAEHAPPPGWISFGIAALAGVTAAWRGPRSTAGFAAAVAVIFLSFFALSKQAFCNYYFMTTGALCCAIAAKDWTWKTQTV